MSSSLSKMLAHVTGGRRYCFVITSFNERFLHFDRIRRLVAEFTGLECIRADDIPASAESIREKVHSCIENAALIIADISESSPNLYYEVGYAAASRRPMIVLTADNKKIPSDLQGLETISYQDSRGGWEQFEAELKRHLVVHQNSNVSLLRAMIVPPEPTPTYLLANPKTPAYDWQGKFHPRERRTFGDNLGIVGILGAYASVFGESVIPELLSAKHVPDDVIYWNANLFLIGAPKVNPHTGLLMEAIQKGKTERWIFECCQDATHPDVEMILKRVNADRTLFVTECLHDPGSYPKPVTDYGLIMRAPHPRFPKRTVTIMAGPHSLGTAAACLASTRSSLVREVASYLDSPESLALPNQLLWVLVKGAADDEGHTSADHIEVVEVAMAQT